jgi:hypothetical protein
MLLVDPTRQPSAQLRGLLHRWPDMATLAQGCTATPRIVFLVLDLVSVRCNRRTIYYVIGVTSVVVW